MLDVSLVKVRVICPMKVCPWSSALKVWKTLMNTVCPAPTKTGPDWSLKEHTVSHVPVTCTLTSIA